MGSKLHGISQTEDNEEVGLIFVIPQNLKENDCDKDMKEAFRIASEDFKPEWKAEDSCLLLAPSKRNVFVLQKFEGPAFEHLKTFKCVSVIGPRCLTHCINLNESTPLVPYPCFTAAMKGLCITTSGGGVEIKNELKKKIELMSGAYVKTLNEKTTHLVVSSVVSTKYEKALQLKIPVLTHDWVDAVWKKSLKEYILATDQIFNVYHCPPFLDLKVSSTGLSIKEQNNLKKALAEHGGEYFTSLTQDINVLVVKNTNGDKYKYAKLWNKPCVELRWIYDCVKSGNALPTKPYEISRGAAASSPTSSNASLNFSINLSTVKIDQRTHIDESIMNSTTSSVASFCPTLKTNALDEMPPPAPRKTPVKSQTPVKCRTPVKLIVQPNPTPGELKHLLSELDLSQAKKAGSFLDGCGIYIMGWNTDEEEILRKVLKCSGATRFTDLNDQVSHVLLGNLEKPFIRVLKNLSFKPHVVNIKWLIESVSEKRPAFEEPFNCMPSENMNVSEAPSPLSKKGMALLQRETFSPKKPLAVQQRTSREIEMSPSKGKKQLLAKYTATDSGENSVSKSMSTSALCMPPPRVPSPKRSSFQQNISLADESDIGGSQDMIFTGLNFLIVGLGDSSTYVEEDLIVKYGGTVVSKTFKGVADYAVVPLSGTPLKQTATDIVTVLWVEGCIDEKKILPISYFHRPVDLDPEKSPLKGCVLGLSGYGGKERQFISELSSALGAVCQEVFAKKSKSNAKASTHLICKSSEGSEKFNAAIKWCRPAVYHEWLLECAASGTRIPEQKFLVDPTQEIKPLDHSNSSTISVSSANSITSKVEPPTVAALRKISSFNTPERGPTYDKAEVDRILSYVPSPNPYAVKTPTEPMGISENPTPGESKRLQKWLDKLPSKLPVPSPALPPRRDSTPLHELRRKIMDKYGTTTPELMKIMHGETEDLDTSIPDSAVAMKAQLNSENSNFHSAGSKSLPTACSTPTLAVTLGTSRKLFDGEFEEPDTQIDGPLDKLNKLMATPEVKMDATSMSSKASNVSFINEQCHKNQVLYDTLKDGSQPYAIKWEDPVNVKRTHKEGYASPPKQTMETLQEEQSTKRKSSENGVDEEPPAKRISSESAENGAQVQDGDTKNEKTTKIKVKSERAPQVTHTFSFSHIDNKEPLLDLIRKLGGTVLDSTSYNPDATHLLIGKAPTRSEKLLAFIAAGKWVLHVRYLLDSGKQGKFVKEEDYEWGNPNGKIECNFEPKSMEYSLSKAVHRWRTTIASKGMTGAFQGFKCHILAPSDKAVAFARLIQAGGGQVLPKKSAEQPKFCLVNMSSHRNSILEYVKLGIPCVPVTFLFEHLTVDPSPEPESKACDEYKTLRKRYLTEH